VEAVWVIFARCRRSAKGRAARFALGDRTRAAFRASGSARTHACERRRRMRLRAHPDAAAARCRRGLGNASTDKDAQWAARVTGNIAPPGPRVRRSCVKAPSLSARALAVLHFSARRRTSSAERLSMPPARGASVISRRRGRAIAAVVRQRVTPGGRNTLRRNRAPTPRPAPFVPRFVQIPAGSRRARRDCLLFRPGAGLAWDYVRDRARAGRAA
jgi:hypothetical protein